jgi:hypothetical protein
LEPPVYRPFALLAFAAALAVGTPLGVAMLVWLYLGGPAVAMPLVLLHAHVQIFGFFGTLIPGIAVHLLARFTGRILEPESVHRWLAAGLGVALMLRIADATTGRPLAALAASIVQAVVFALFAARVWRALRPPAPAVLRVQLTVATGWLTVACSLEAAARVAALAREGAFPDVGALRAVHMAGLLGGVLGWVLGVLGRAGPMFVAGWGIPRGLERAVPALLGVAVLLAVAGETGVAGLGAVWARTGELLALATAGAVLGAGGAFRRADRALPMLSRSPAEARLFRLAAASSVAAVVAAGLAVAAAAQGGSEHVLADAARHLLTVGVLTTVVVAMMFRLLPVLERRALAWPGARPAALWLLLGAVVLRAAEVAVSAGFRWLAPAVALSGLAVWGALAAVAVNLGAAALVRPRSGGPAAGRSAPGSTAGRR